MTDSRASERRKPKILFKKTHTCLSMLEVVLAELKVF